MTLTYYSYIWFQVLSVDIEAINLMLLHVNTMGIDSLLHVTVNDTRLSGEVLTDRQVHSYFADVVKFVLNFLKFYTNLLESRRRL